MVSRAMSDSKTGLFGSAAHSVDRSDPPGTDLGVGSPTYVTV